MPAVETTDPTQWKYDYDAFVSYRRRDATAVAQWIRNKLQHFRLPPEILRELPREKQELHDRRPQIWLDTSYEKSNDDFLLRKVFPALDGSARLIVVSTPAALESLVGKEGQVQDNWLAREIDHFLGTARAGEADRPIDVVFGPGAIEGRYPGRLSEKPRWDWIDFRSFTNWRASTFSEALDDGFIKLIAGFYDVPDRFLPILHREEHRRRQKTIMGFGIAGFITAALMAGLALYALIQRKDAILALDNALKARAQMSVQLATEQMQNRDPDSALATALAGVDTPTMDRTDNAIIPESITSVANSIANETFGGALYDQPEAISKVFLGADATSAITVTADGKVVRWGRENGYPLRPANFTSLAGSAFAVSQSSGMTASGSPFGQIHFWNSSTPESSSKPFEFGETPIGLAFNEDGRQIAALGERGRLAILDIAQNKAVWAAPTQVRDATIIVPGPNCNCLAVGTATGDLLIWPLDRNEAVRVRGASGRVTNGSFGHDGQFSFTTDDGRLWLTSAPSWQPPINVGRHEGNIIAYAMAPDGKRAATSSTDGTTIIWDLATRLPWTKVKPIADATVTSITFSPDSDVLALAYGDGTVAVSDMGAVGTEQAAALVMRGHSSAILDLSFSPDGGWLASASLDRSVRLWQLHTARHPRMRQAHQGQGIHAVSKNGRYLISGGSIDKKIQLWTGPIWEPGKSIILDDQPSNLAISDDGKRAFIGTYRGDVIEWDTNGSKTTTFSQDNGVLSAIALSPDGKTLATIGVDAAKWQICNVQTSPPQCVRTNALDGWGYSVSFSADGHWSGAASGIEGTTGRGVVWDLAANKPTILTGHSERVLSIQFDKSGQRAVTASWDGTVRIWDVSTGNELVRLVEPRGRTSTAGFSPDSDWVATVSYDKTLRLWNVPGTSTGQAVKMETSNSKLVSDTANIGAVKFAPDVDLLAASIENGNIQLWHVPDGTLRAVLGGDGSPVQSMYFHPDSKQITAMTRNGNLISWSLSTALSLGDKSLLSLARSMLPKSGSLSGKPGEFSIIRPSAQEICGFLHEPNLGLPPHNLSGPARARQRIRVPDTCKTAGAQATPLSVGLIAEIQGDLPTARMQFEAALAGEDFSAEIGLGDLDFVDDPTGAETRNALSHYTMALAHGVHHAESRLGWFFTKDGSQEKMEQAKKHFERASEEGDADGFAGLGWINERFGNSPQDIEAAFSSYIKAQYAYERDGDVTFAQMVAERRALLARLIAAERVAELFIAARSALSSIKGTNR